MSLHLNGLDRPDALLKSTGMSAEQLGGMFRRHYDRLGKRTYSLEAAHELEMPMGMVLEQRGNVYGDVRNVPAATVAKRRARNKAARAARRVGRR